MVLHRRRTSVVVDFPSDPIPGSLEASVLNCESGPPMGQEHTEMGSMAEDEPKRERDQTGATPKPHDPTLAQRKREGAFLLCRIKPEASLELARGPADFGRYFPPFSHSLP